MASSGRGPHRTSPAGSSRRSADRTGPTPTSLRKRAAGRAGSRLALFPRSCTGSSRTSTCWQPTNRFRRRAVNPCCTASPTAACGFTWRSAETQERIRRGRPSAAIELVHRRWTSWRGPVVEPLIRDALSLAAGELPWPDATTVGGWWNRAFQPEIDLIGADRGPVARTIHYAGSVK
ncbi:MAG TPA: DUF234 domain-containing protein [Streptosporangiaceae bacterium]|nr:DUF234 domain-containing protein [Streptosporangiaceae bacterium]